MSFGQGGGGPFGGPPRDGGGTAGGQSGPFGAFGPFGGAPRGPGDDGDRGPGGPFGGGGSSAARGRGRPGRPSALVLTIIAVAVLVGLFVVFTNVYTDVLWFSQLGFTEVFWTEVVAKAALFPSITLTGNFGRSARPGATAPRTRPRPRGTRSARPSASWSPSGAWCSWVSRSCSACSPAPPR